MTAILFPEFRAQGTGNLYPFVDLASLTARSGLVLDRDLVVDASVYPVGGQARLGITQITVRERQVTLAIGDPALPVRATVRFGALEPPAALALVDPYGRAAGLLLLDVTRAAAIATWPEGLHEFPAGAAEFVASCAIPVPGTGLRGIKVGTGPLHTGDVWLVGRDGVVVTEQDGTIRIDAVGDPLFLRRQCGPDGLFEPANFLRTLTVYDHHGKVATLHPDAYGNITMVVGDQVARDTILRFLATAPGTLQLGAVGHPANE